MIHMSFSRRRVLSVMASALIVSVGFVSTHASAADALRIGFQKSASLLTLLKSEGVIEKRLAPAGVEVKWVEFPAGPQMLEGLNVGAIDLGFVGEAPPIFAQAAGADFVYVGYEPASPEAEGILVPKNSSLKSVADLKGKRVALNKGSNVHYLLVKALEKAGLKYSDIEPAFLTPADARAAFEKGAVDAWAIWDPFQSAAEKQVDARRLTSGTGVVNNFQYYLAARGYAQKNRAAIDTLFDELVKQSDRLKKNPKESAALIAPLQGLDVAVVELALQRYQFGVKPVTPAILADQQKLADTFFELKLIPKAIRVSEALVQAQR